MIGVAPTRAILPASKGRLFQGQAKVLNGFYALEEGDRYDIVDFIFSSHGALTTEHRALVDIEDNQEFFKVLLDKVASCDEPSAMSKLIEVLKQKTLHSNDKEALERLANDLHAASPSLDKGRSLEGLSKVAPVAISTQGLLGRENLEALRLVTKRMVMSSHTFRSLLISAGLDPRNNPAAEILLIPGQQETFDRIFDEVIPHLAPRQTLDFLKRFRDYVLNANDKRAVDGLIQNLSNSGKDVG